MPGRESEYMRGYLRGVAAMMNLITSDKVKKLDKTNVLQYARELVEKMKEERQ
jgi:small nuclear ribonucleoprotein (snRNP)-like protein